MALKISPFLFGFSWIILTACFQYANAETNDPDRFALPRTKVNIPICEKQALQLYPGTLAGIRTQHQNSVFLLQIKIIGRDGSESSVLCDMTTGKIIQAKTDRCNSQN